MEKLHLQSTEYKEFVLSHILRPYQNYILTDKPIEFNVKYYNSIPEYVNDYPEWADKVFNRIAEIFKTIDTGVFPSDLSVMVILTECAKRGVVIKYT